MSAWAYGGANNEEDFGDVPNRHGRTVALELPGDVEQTTHVAGEQGAGTRRNDACRFLAHDVARDL